MTYHDALMNQLTTLVAHVRKLRSRLQQVMIQDTYIHTFLDLYDSIQKLAYILICKNCINQGYFSKLFQKHFTK